VTSDWSARHRPPTCSPTRSRPPAGWVECGVSHQPCCCSCRNLTCGPLYGSWWDDEQRRRRGNGGTRRGSAVGRRHVRDHRAFHPPRSTGRGDH
jgi:hypothetical protein